MKWNFYLGTAVQTVKGMIREINALKKGSTRIPARIIDEPAINRRSRP